MADFSMVAGKEQTKLDPFQAESVVRQAEANPNGRLIQVFKDAIGASS